MQKHCFNWEWTLIFRILKVTYLVKPKLERNYKWNQPFRHVVPQAKFARGIVWEFLDTAGGEKIATHVFKAQFILGQ